LYRCGYMPPELLTLLRRDHADLELELTALLDPTAPIAELRTALDGVRLGLTAHAEAEDIVLGRFESCPALATAIAKARAAHMAQESALASLVTIPLGTAAWRDRVHHLRELVRFHSKDEELHLVPALREHPDYRQLAGNFATERLRQLAMLQPSVPVFVWQVAATA
jgi:hypothetical protein